MADNNTTSAFALIVSLLPTCAPWQWLAAQWLNASALPQKKVPLYVLHRLLIPLLLLAALLTWHVVHICNATLPLSPSPKPLMRTERNRGPL